MNIFFNSRLIEGAWGGGNQFLFNLMQLLKKKGHNILFELEKGIDLIFIIENYRKIDPKILRFKKKNPSTKVIHRINECDKRKETNNVDKIIFKNNTIADATVFISSWLAKYFIQKGFKKPYEVIYNGCDTAFFYPKENKVIGNVINLVTHHWSSNWLKGFDIYKAIDKILENNQDLSFTYIGNYNKEYTPKYTKIIPPLYGQELGNELRKYDIYITASRWEPCGMHHIEGASCGLPVLYHSEGGGINEACKNYGLEYSDIDSLIERIYKIKDSYRSFRENISYEFLSSDRCCKAYYNEILKMFE